VNARLHLLLILGSGILLIGCAVARSSYHVITAPVRLFTGGSEQSTQPPVTTTTTTTTVAANSDVAAPGGPVASPAPAHVQRRVQGTRIAGESPSPTSATHKRQDEAKAKTSPSPHASPVTAEFPTAKAVPGKPGYVFDPFDANGGYIDVSGYAPGSKVKDPATKKIFIVP
jgi:hypothetical protein